MPYLGYELPLGLEVASGVLLHYVCSGERLFGSCYTRCAPKQLVDVQHPLTVGGFHSFRDRSRLRFPPLYLRLLWGVLLPEILDPP